ncbi:pirin family protein [Rhodoblastus sp.]|uniref:pirin family protein n=1 Tax=Rhodoblastus sp. TaxID=1962975 RepID=UPI00261CBCD9|nr:pirin family protein [Rhodoblastus sp.]
MNVATEFKARKVIAVTHGEATSDGAGVKMTRLIGSGAQPPIDPFLMLDFFGSERAGDYIGGFPDHPHRGFETVTYMLAGRMRHSDNHGHSGVIDAGDVQWMKAGRGLIHSEMPEQDHGLMRGFQLWINLPASEKMSPPAYQEFKAAQMPVEEREGARVKIIAGAGTAGLIGPVRAPHVDATYLDVELAPGGAFRQPLPAGHQAFFVLYDGEAAAPGDAGPQLFQALSLLALGEGEEATLTGGPAGARALLLAARPLREPIAWSGPFVMNTRQELIQAYEDYRQGKF